jgi:hypothetical protein
LLPQILADKRQMKTSSPRISRKGTNQKKASSSRCHLFLKLHQVYGQGCKGVRVLSFEEA